MVSRKDSNQARLKRHKRVRAKLSGTAARPRLAVYRSNANISAQIIDDVAGATLVSASTLERRLKESAATRLRQERSANCWLSARLQKESPKSYSTVAAIFITDVYRNWLKALARAA